MKDALLCLNPEWQGCESTILEKGSKRLAQELFNCKMYKNFGTTDVPKLEIKDNIFALDFIAKQFVRNLNLIREKSPQRVLTVGGSCGIDAAPVSYLNSRYEGDLAVVWFDAHGDLNTPASSPSGHFHGMILRTLLGEGPEEFCKHIERPLDSRQVFLAGVRDLDLSEKQYIEKSNISDCEVDVCLADLVLQHGFSKVYIHIDVDVIDPDDFSDALMPTNGGPTREEISKCISVINERLDIVGLSVVEYCGEHENSAKQVAQMLEKAGITSQ
ncbi:MAG: arginase family protein [Pseudoalteromonas distincta]